MRQWFKVPARKVQTTYYGTAREPDVDEPTWSAAVDLGDDGFIIVCSTDDDSEPVVAKASDSATDDEDAKSKFGLDDKHLRCLTTAGGQKGIHAPAEDA